MVRCDGLLYDLLWGVPLSVLKVYIIWLSWLLIFMRIQEIFNITDGRDRNFGVDYPFLFFYFFQKSLDSPNIFNYRCYSHKYAFLPDTWNFKPSSSFHERCENVRVTDGHFGHKCHCWQHPCRKMVRSENFCNLKLSEQPNFYNLG